MGWASKRRPHRRPSYLSQASCVIVSGFRAALDMDTYLLSIYFIRQRCAERAKRGRGKPVLIMHIGFFACFYAISLERSRFSKIAVPFSCPCGTEDVGIAHKPPRSLQSENSRRQTDKQTDRQTDTHTHRTTTVTLAAHARRGLITMRYPDFEHAHSGGEG